MIDLRLHGARSAPTSQHISMKKEVLHTHIYIGFMYLTDLKSTNYLTIMTSQPSWIPHWDALQNSPFLQPSPLPHLLPSRACIWGWSFSPILLLFKNHEATLILRISPSAQQRKGGFFVCIWRKSFPLIASDGGMKIQSLRLASTKIRLFHHNIWGWCSCFAFGAEHPNNFKKSYFKICQLHVFIFQCKVLS